MNFDYDLFVIGAGSGGVRASRFAAGYGAKVGIAEDTYLGGTCVNVGCVPKKLFTYAAHFHHDAVHAGGFGWSTNTQFNWPLLRDNKNREIARLNGVYRKLLTQSGVTIHDGHATLVDNHTVAINGKTLTAKYILLATGAKPRLPVMPGIEHVLTSDAMFFLDTLPRDIVIVGGGYIAVEFAGILSGLGVRVTQLYRGDLFLRGFDHELRERLAEEVRKTAVDLRFNISVTAIDKQSDGRLSLQLDNGNVVSTDAVLYATGRAPRLQNLGIENVGIELDERGFVRVDDNYQTTAPGIYAIGDIIPGMELTPRALAEGMALAKNLFAGGNERVDYSFIPTAVFSQPNVATVGYSEEEARKMVGAIDVYTEHFTPLKHSLSGSAEKCFMKMIVDATSDRVIGVHMIGDNAGEIMQGIAVAIKAGATKADFDRTIGIHPTAAEELVTMREKTR